MHSKSLLALRFFTGYLLYVIPAAVVLYLTLTTSPVVQLNPISKSWHEISADESVDAVFAARFSNLYGIQVELYSPDSRKDYNPVIISLIDCTTGTVITECEVEAPAAGTVAFVEIPVDNYKLELGEAYQVSIRSADNSNEHCFVGAGIERSDRYFGHFSYIHGEATCYVPTVRLLFDSD